VKENISRAQRAPSSGGSNDRDLPELRGDYVKRTGAYYRAACSGLQPAPE
jgi:hypothetical protein